MEHAIRGNSVAVRCIVPSFVADHVSVDAWLVDGDAVHADSGAGSRIAQSSG